MRFRAASRLLGDPQNCSFQCALHHIGRKPILVSWAHGRGIPRQSRIVFMGNRLFAIAMLVGITILSVVCPVDSAWAQRKEKRMALVVGNSNYSNVPKLPNPQRDAISVGQM